MAVAQVDGAGAFARVFEYSNEKGVEPTAGAAPAATTAEAPIQDAIEMHLPADRAGEPAATEARPFSDYALPLSEAALSSRAAAESEGLHAALVTAVSDVAKSLFEEGGVAWIKDRADFLAQNPEEGVFTALVAAPHLQALLAETLTHAFSTQPLGRLPEGYGEGAQALLSAGRGAVLDVILGRFLGHEVVPSAVAARFADTLARSPLSGLGFGDIASTLRAKGVPAGAFSFTGADGKIKPGALGGLFGNIGIGTLEASLEYFIALSGRLIKGDIGKDIDAMSARLSDLKKEKQGIVGKIIELEGSIVGKQASMADAVKRANEAQQCAKIWSLIGCIIALVVVIVVAVVVSIFSFGAGAPAAIAGVAAMIGVTLSVGAATALAISLAVAAIVIAVITFIQSIPMLLEGVAMIAQACGNQALAEKLRETAKEFASFMDRSGLGTALMVISLVATLYMAVIMLPMGCISAALTVTQIAGMVIGGVARLGAAFAMKDMAKALRELEILREELARVELEIKALMQKLEAKRTEEKEINEDVEQRQDYEAKVMENLNKAAESYKQILAAAALN